MYIAWVKSPSTRGMTDSRPVVVFNGRAYGLSSNFGDETKKMRYAGVWVVFSKDKNSALTKDSYLQPGFNQPMYELELIQYKGKQELPLVMMDRIYTAITRYERLPRNTYPYKKISG